MRCRPRASCATLALWVVLMVTLFPSSHAVQSEPLLTASHRRHLRISSVEGVVVERSEITTQRAMMAAADGSASSTSSGSDAKISGENATISSSDSSHKVSAHAETKHVVMAEFYGPIIAGALAIGVVLSVIAVKHHFSDEEYYDGIGN